MKKIFSVILFSSVVTLSFAQVQRKAAKPASVDTTASVAGQKDQKDGPGRKEIMKELNLSREQKGKMKEIKQSGKAKKEAIEGDTNLSATDKDAKLKALRKEQTKSIMSVLNDEQKGSRPQQTVGTAFLFCIGLWPIKLATDCTDYTNF